MAKANPRLAELDRYLAGDKYPGVEPWAYVLVTGPRTLIVVDDSQVVDRLDVRTWVLDPDTEEYFPTKKGLTIPYTSCKEVAALIRAHAHTPE